MILMARQSLVENPAPVAPDRRCASCRHFSGLPREVEAHLPGMRSLGSAHGSVRATDGICRLHDRYLAPTSSCMAHEPEL
jgi:hypothetical protein